MIIRHIMIIVHLRVKVHLVIVDVVVTPGVVEAVINNMDFKFNNYFNGSTPTICVSGICLPMPTAMSFEMTDAHIEILKHALGFKKDKRSFYRNYYGVIVDSPNYTLVQDLAEHGYLQRTNANIDSYLLNFKVTQKGIDYIKLFWPKRKKKEDIIRIGDKVKIINPRIIDRVGYPKSVEDIIRNEFTKEDADKVDGLISHLSGLPRNIFTPYNKSYDLKREHLFDYIVRECAYIRLKRNGFGGNARTIHYKEIANDIKDLEFDVVGKKLAKTGTRVGGTPEYFNGSYDIDAEGPSFNEEATHIILTVEWHDEKFIYGDGKDPFMYMNKTITDEKHKKFKIEACDVEKVK